MLLTTVGSWGPVPLGILRIVTLEGREIGASITHSPSSSLIEIAGRGISSSALLGYAFLQMGTLLQLRRRQSVGTLMHMLNVGLQPRCMELSTIAVLKSVGSSKCCFKSQVSAIPSDPFSIHQLERTFQNTNMLSEHSPNFDPSVISHRHRETVKILTVSLHGLALLTPNYFHINLLHSALQPCQRCFISPQKPQGLWTCGSLCPVLTHLQAS